MPTDIDIHHLCLGCMTPKGSATVCPQCGWREGTESTIAFCLRAGTILNDCYLLGRMLDHSGTGIRYLGWDLNHNCKCVIAEYLPCELATRDTDHLSVAAYQGEAQVRFNEGLRRFLEIGRGLMTLREHSVLASTRDIVVTNGTGYWITEPCDGVTLQQHLEQHVSMPLKHVMYVMLPVLDALHAMHEADLLHLYLNPDIIYLTQNRSIKLCVDPSAIHSVGFQAYGNQTDNPGYWPIELYRLNAQVGPWTDVYGGAAVFYKALTGKPPVPARERISQTNLETPSQLGISIPRSIETALIKALAVQPKDRFLNINAFKRALLQGEYWPYRSFDKLVMVFLILGSLILAIMVLIIVIFLDRQGENFSKLPVTKTQEVIPEEQNRAVESPSPPTLKLEDQQIQVKVEQSLKDQRDRLFQLQQHLNPQRQQLEIMIFAEDQNFANKVADTLRRQGYKNAFSNSGKPHDQLNIKYGAASAELIEEISLILATDFGIPVDLIKMERVFLDDDKDVFINLPVITN